jgi:hypothetical protein
LKRGEVFDELGMKVTESMTYLNSASFDMFAYSVVGGGVSSKVYVIGWLSCLSYLMGVA